MRAIGYVRLSNLTDQSTAPARQRAQIRAYCEAKGWELVDTVEDLDVSGSSVGLRLDRPGLQTVRARWAEADVLVVAKLDRLARNVADFSALVEEAGGKGVALASVSEGLDLTTPAGRFVATILAAFAEMEAATIRARIMDSRAHLREAGRFAGGVVPYGYAAAPREGGGRTLVPYAAEAAVVQDAAADVLAGRPLYAVVRRLNDAGVPTKRGGHWDTVTLHRCLTGWSVTGVPSHKGRPVRGEDGEPLQAYPPILSRETFHRVRELLARKPRGGRARPPVQLLAAFARCGVCGSRIYSGTSRGQRVYRCASAASGRSCGLGGVRAHLADPVVEDAVLGKYGSYPVVRVERQETDHGAELADVEHALQEATDALRGDDVDPAQVLTRVAELKSRRTALRGAPGASHVERHTGWTLAEYWAVSDTRERARLLAAVLDRVEILPGRVGGVFDPERLRLVWSEDPSLVTPFEELGAGFGYVRLT